MLQTKPNEKLDPAPRSSMRAVLSLAKFSMQCTNLEGPVSMAGVGANVTAYACALLAVAAICLALALLWPRAPCLKLTMSQYSNM